jgi:hypothetical protein
MIHFLIEVLSDFIPNDFLPFKNSIILINESCYISEDQSKKFRGISNLENLPKSDYFYMRIVSDLHKGLIIGKILNKFKITCFFTISVEKYSSIIPNKQIIQFPGLSQTGPSLQVTNTGDCNPKKLKLTKKPYDLEEVYQNIEYFPSQSKKFHQKSKRNYSDLNHNQKNSELRQDPSIKNFSRPFKSKNPPNCEARPPHHCKEIREKPPEVIRFIFNQEKEQLEKTQHPKNQVVPQVSPQITLQDSPQVLPQKTLQVPEQKNSEYFQLLQLVKNAEIEKCFTFFEVFSALFSHFFRETGKKSHEKVEKCILKMFEFNILSLTCPDRSPYKDFKSYSMKDKIKVKL